MPKPTIPYEQLHANDEESGSVGKTQIKKTFEVLGTQRRDFIFETFGYVAVNQGDQNVYIRTLGWECPDWPGLFPKEWRIKKAGRSRIDENNADGIGVYAKSHIEITWGEPEFQDLTEDLDTGSVVLWSIRVLGKNSYETIPNRNIKFSSDNKPINQPIAVTSQETHYELTLHRIPILPTAQFEQIQGCCNPAQFTARDKNGNVLIDAPAETLKLDDWYTDERETTFSVDGVFIPSWTVRLLLVKRLNGWNKVRRPDTGAIAATTPSGGITPISPLDFGFLLSLQT